MKNPWFSGSADISTYAIDELLCTKLRALYQRKKGRDLFDIWLALDRGHIDPATLLTCFDRYMIEDGCTVTRAQFEANLAQKRTQPDFRDDVGPLLRPGFSWSVDAAMDSVLEYIVARLPRGALEGRRPARGAMNYAPTGDRPFPEHTVLAFLCPGEVRWPRRAVPGLARSSADWNESERGGDHVRRYPQSV